MWEMLQSDTVLLLDADELEKGKLVRAPKPVSGLTDIGKTCRDRGRLECSRRFCGNDSQTEDNGQPPVWNVDVRVVSRSIAPNGGQFDFVWLSARTPHGAYVC